MYENVEEIKHLQKLCMFFSVKWYALALTYWISPADYYPLPHIVPSKKTLDNIKHILLLHFLLWYKKYSLVSLVKPNNKIMSKLNVIVTTRVHITLLIQIKALMLNDFYQLVLCWATRVFFMMSINENEWEWMIKYHNKQQWTKYFCIYCERTAIDSK